MTDQILSMAIIGLAIIGALALVMIALGMVLIRGSHHAELMLEETTRLDALRGLPAKFDRRIEQRTHVH